MVTTGGSVGGTFGTVDVHGQPGYDVAYNPANVTLTARGPAMPTLTGTSPASGSDDNAPKVVGTSGAGTTVKIYANSGCTGAPAATGTAAELAAGIAVTVADNSTTTFHATATDVDGTSPCSSSSVTYAEVTPASPPATPAKPGAAQIAKGPAKKTTKKKATFTFSATDAASYECKLDKGAFAACTSPAKFKKLKRGKHTFEVHAIGAGGDPGTSATYKWKVKKKKKK